MSLVGILPQLCDIERFTENDEDEYGLKTGTWDVVEQDRPCRLENFSGQEFTDRRNVNQAAWRSFMEPDVDVIKDDRYRDKGTGDLFRIVTIETQYRPGTGPHHKVVWLSQWVD